MILKGILCIFLLGCVLDIGECVQKYITSPESPPSHVRVPKRSLKDDAERDEFYYDSFPDDFLWGLATASYQIEGAWNLNGKGEQIWDTFTHFNNGSNIADGKNGDVACDSYHKYNEDVQILKNMGADFYRFSLSWSRMIPTGKIADGINQDGLDYYNNLINALVAEGIIPMVTLYHWDLPQALMDIGGWPNEDLAQHYADYAGLAFATFGDRVKHWITFNEPWVFCQLGYAYGSHAPGIRDAAESPYKCVHTIIKSHGLAYRIYESEFQQSQQGQIGITLDGGWAEPTDRNNPDDWEASERAMQFHYGWFANPLYRGEYPPIMRELVDAKSAAEGRNSSRLPHFDAAWTWIINGTLDFIGLNHYNSEYVFPTEGGPPGHDGDKNTGGWIDPEWEHTAADWLRIVPWGFRRLLNWVSKEYGNPPMYVTENGCADRGEDWILDAQRVNYYMKYTNEMLKAIKIDGNNVKAYTAWSLIDNLEWAAGYTQRFGVNYVNFSDPNLTRTPKDSAIFLTELFRNNGFPAPGESK